MQPMPDKESMDRHANASSVIGFGHLAHRRACRYIPVFLLWLLQAGHAGAQTHPAYINAQAPKKFAVVIGNYEYQDPISNLPSVEADISRISDELRKLSFDVTPLANIDKPETLVSATADAQAARQSLAADIQARRQLPSTVNTSFNTLLKAVARALSRKKSDVCHNSHTAVTSIT